MTGILNPCANPFEKQTPANKVPAKPGPFVTAIPSKLLNEIPASSMARNTSEFKRRSCSLDASSGTTPPKD